MREVSLAKDESFRQLIVWRRAIELTFAVYAATKEFPKDELFGLTSQMRRASVSVASNIAEGHARATEGEFVQFLGIARGSLAEVQTQLVIDSGLRLASGERLELCEELSVEVSKMLDSLLRQRKSK